jgi:hypothetical protein
MFFLFENTPHKPKKNVKVETEKKIIKLIGLFYLKKEF